MQLNKFIGKSRSITDIAGPGPVARLAALLDHSNPPWPTDEVPPLAHWLYFLPQERQSDLESDGHPRRGEFLPHSPQSRRMWAGGRIEFLAPLPIGARMERISTIEDVSVKTGARGEMLFVQVAHDIIAEDTRAIRETQNLVYLNPAPKSAATEREATDTIQRPYTHKRRHTANTVELFRFSAMTFNSHRIHYDQSYAQTVEHYPALVVHGPYSAILLMDFFLQSCPGRRVSSFEFRAKRPLFVDEPFHLHINGPEPEYNLWICNDKGIETMSASLTTV